MDTDAVIARRPQVAVVDELAHTNVPGSARNKRWEDVIVLLDAGVDVMTTMNVQHIESLNDRMREITGIEVRETVPDWIVKRANEIVLVDIPPQALLNRLQRGVVYSPEKAKAAMEHFFKEHTLGALREVALRQTAHEVETRQAGASAANLNNDRTAERVSAPEEKVLIHVSEVPSTAALIRRGSRVAAYLKGECVAVCILPTGRLADLDQKTRGSIEKHLDFARKLRIETEVLVGADPAATLVDYARNQGVTQIFLAKPIKRHFSFLALRDFVMKVIRLAKDMQVIVVAEQRV
jgi:two-component system sensor histidine kinase KdpD